MNKNTIDTTNRVEVYVCALVEGKCWGCQYADECPDWLGLSKGNPPTIMVDPATVSKGWY